MDTTTRIAALSALVAAALAGCGAADVETSSEYTDLLDERDGLASELEDVRAELDDLDDQLAASAAQLSDAEEQLAAGAALTDDLNALLALDITNRVGLSPTDAQCVADAFVDDDETRGAYLVLIDPEQTDQTAMETAYGQVTTIMADCGLEIAGSDDTVPPSEASAALADVLGDVAIIGAALPLFTEGAVDPAVGMAAPVVVGVDYTGEPVTVDAATNGPTMVVVMAHWCPHCNAEIPKINQLRDEGRIPDGVAIVAVSSGVDPDRDNFPPDTWLDSVDWTFPVVADGLDGTGAFIASGAYGTAGVPFVTLIDGEGNVAGRWAGERSIEEIEAALTQLAGE